LILSKKLSLSGILVFVLLVFVFVVTVEAHFSTTWSQTYGGEARDSAESVIQTFDGGYAIAGDTLLVKTNASGNMEWTQTYDDYAYALVETSDGGYVIGGVTWSKVTGNSDWWLVKTNASGNVEWKKTYGGTSSETAFSLVGTSDGGYAITGYTFSFGAGESDFWLVKTDASGNVEWNRTYGGAIRDIARSLVVTSDGGYALAGSTDSFGAGQYDFWLIKTDQYGNMEWNQTYGGAYADYAYSLVETSDGGYVIAGRTLSFGAGSNDFWLVKTDSSGKMEWSQSYGGEGDDRAESLVESFDGGFVLAGVKDGVRDQWDSHPIGGNFLLVKTDNSGNMEWNRTYGGDSVAWAKSVVQTSDGGYAIAGEESGDFWLIKTDECGCIPEWYPPYVCVNSPQNVTYTTGNVSLNFTVNEETTWMGYSLDGQDNVTITKNTLTLTELADGSYNITVYATDTDGNTAASKTVSFTIAKENETEPPPTTSWTTTAIATAAVATAAIGATLLIIYAKTKKQNKN